MADTKISALPASTTPLAGTEVLPIVQSGATKKVSVDNLTTGKAVSMASATVSSGNLLFSFTAQRISGDFSNATPANRLLFQSSTTNGATVVGAIPNGTGTTSQWVAYNSVDPSNSSLGQFLCTATEVRINSNATGTGTYLPITIYASGAKQFTFDTSGNFVPANAAKGINFTANTGAAGKTSQLLNWYEEGTWTPTLVIGSGSVTYTTQTGTYTRIGRLVTISGNIVINTVSSPGSYVVINSLPYAPTGLDRGAGVVFADKMGTGCPQIELQIRGSNGDIYFQTFSLGATGNLGGYLQATSVLAFTATYEV